MNDFFLYKTFQISLNVLIVFSFSSSLLLPLLLFDSLVGWPSIPFQR